MTLRTSGKAEHYRYYTCCTKARKGKTGCKGRTVPMQKLDSLVIAYLEQRLLDPERLNEMLAALLDRRQAHGVRHQDRIAQLKRQAADADGKLTRLYTAIEDGIADPKDDNLKGRLAELKSIRDAAQADVARLEGKGRARPIEITPEIVGKFAAEARRKMRTDQGGYRRHHIQALAQRVDVGETEIRITGSKLTLLRTLVASGGVVGTATNDVRSFVPKWLPFLDTYRTMCRFPDPLLGGFWRMSGSCVSRPRRGGLYSQSAVGIRAERTRSVIVHLFREGKGKTSLPSARGP